MTRRKQTRSQRGNAGKNKSAPAAKRGARSAKPKRQQNLKQQTIIKGRQEAPYPHFRRYKKSGHPALIVGEQVNDKNKEEYNFRKVMHDDRDGRHLNEKVEPNPDPTDKKPMYIAKRVRHDEKQRFDEKPLPWKYQHKKK